MHRKGLLWILLALAPGFAQEHQHMHEEAGQSQMGPAVMFLMEEASGTSVDPASSPHSMLTARFRSWNLMFHALAFIGDIQQTGPRGGDKFVSTNWAMGMAHREIGKGALSFRAMLSLEPLTVADRRYPELFQTGETAFGRPLVDAQHPHNFVMELAAQYARPLGRDTLFDVYIAPVGEPALGPVAFPHRISASEIPQAPLAHHLQDSTHISFDVVTAGLKHGPVRIEASGFHGAEPGENRWTIGYGAIDSWSTRLWVTPSKNWSGQVSVGRLAKPEALEEGDIVRSTASVTYNRPLPSGNWATSFIWGRNHKTFDRTDTNSYLLESILRLGRKHHVTGRFEAVEKDELFADRPDLHNAIEHSVGHAPRIQAYTLGYTRDFNLFRGLQTGLGGNFTLYAMPSALNPYYGSRPVGFLFFLRVRPQPAA